MIDEFLVVSIIDSAIEDENEKEIGKQLCQTSDIAALTVTALKAQDMLHRQTCHNDDCRHSGPLEYVTRKFVPESKVDDAWTAGFNSAANKVTA